MNTTTANPTADQIVTGTTTDGEAFSVARYDTLVVVTIDGNSDDTQCATVAEAIKEYNDLADPLVADAEVETTDADELGNVETETTTPDAQASGESPEGETYKLTRRGTVVVIDLDDYPVTKDMGTVEAATAEYDVWLLVLTDSSATN